jgi:hypothetical protein
MLIILSRDHPELYRSLKPAQEANGRDRLILDRRVAERRQGVGPPRRPDRRKGERRAPVTDADRALMLVLGFMVIHPESRLAVADPFAAAGPAPAPSSRAAG